MTRERWDPAVYLSFEDHRLRPAIELISRIPDIDVSSMVDLGCGPGNVTSALLGRWPTQHYVGIDTSSEMLERARQLHPGLEWQQADASTWRPDPAPDLIFSNATLHWLDDHDHLFPALLDSVRSGGVLAVQMPDNFGAPTHTCIEDAIRSGSWSVDLEAVLRPRPVSDALWYHRLLEARCEHLDIWTTTYLQVLTGADPVVSWTSGSALRPFLTSLPAAEHEAFLGLYRDLVSPHYPASADGETVVVPFTRVFIVAQRL